MLLSSIVAQACDMRSQFADIHRAVEARLERWIMRGQAEGNIRRDIEPTAFSLTIGSLMFGINMQFSVDPTVDFGAMRSTSLGMLRRALEA